MTTTSEDLLDKVRSLSQGYVGGTLKKNSALEDADRFSSSMIATLRREAGAAGEALRGVECIAVAGSFARRDACQESDLDLVTILDDSKSFDQSKFNEWLDGVARSLKLERSNPTGVFAKPIEQSELLEMAGDMMESYENLSRRVLLLLESDWIFGEDSYNKSIDMIVDKYSEDVKLSPRKNFVFLLNDVIRYFRTICVNYQHSKVNKDSEKWPIRNVKLRHSRVLMYFSMVAVIGSLSRYEGDNKISVLREFIDLTPLQRLFVVYELSQDSGYFRLAEYYNVFMGLISKADVRGEIKGLEYDRRYESASFAHLKANSDALASELLRFFRRQENVWDDRFFEYMII